MRLADAAGADEKDVVAGLDEPERAQIRNRLPVDRRLIVIVEILECLPVREN